ncbi:hypothetical protein OCF84_09140 [Shewanella xiamenensis]|uniref:hypothetical protein n=1 Tax=Shewanella xiamenensis TaxID=332186 RepID=UPI00214FDAFE|nr:hypothetical protein [Shewanella xiamenensis]MCR4536276.1 hypothetical protein [Shewanella xiamenensis]WHF57352.1 hypothetical protein OCF84_09140 [Shewanella xiamenensis]
MGIKFQAEYIDFIMSQGVGSNDKVASSVNSYLSYLRSVSRHLGVDICPETLSCEDAIQGLSTALDGVRRPRTIGNYVSAMRQYVAMVHELGFLPNENLSIANELVEMTAPAVAPIAPDLSCKHSDSEDVGDEVQEDEKITGDSNLDEKHFLHSSFREKLLEHLFMAELLKCSWLEHTCELEIAKLEVDSKGYDLIAENKGIVRHIQLKSTKRGGNAAAQNIHMSLGTKPSGCVVWIEFDEHTLEMGPYRFFGADAGDMLPSLEDYPVAKHTKANAEGKKTLRPQLRRIGKSKFQVVNSMDELYRILFG